MKKRMNVMVIGSGGREHALVWKMSQSPLVEKIYCIPGNGGMGTLAECIDIPLSDFNQLINFAKEKHIGLTVVGPELPLVQGIVDAFSAADLLVFGPSRDAAQLEGSKVFSKTVMQKYGVPTASFCVFSDPNEAKNYALHAELPMVIKADGLAAGKGVVIAKTTAEAIKTVHEMMVDGIFGEAGKRIIIEECICGEELSILAFTDGTHIVPLASSQDHKRAYDHDEGPNTGGMGAYSPCPLVSHSDLHTLVERTIKPTIAGLRSEGIIFKGLIYAGLMITKKGPMVLEYNVRFGDPETQAVLPRLKDDIVDLFLQVARGTLEKSKLAWDERASITVVVASGGYPNTYEKGYRINGLDAVHDENVMVFHAGTIRKPDGSFVNAGGRVLNVTALGETLKEARAAAYRVLERISFEKSFYRRDIGERAFQYTAS